MLLAIVDHATESNQTQRVQLKRSLAVLSLERVVVAAKNLFVPHAGKHMITALLCDLPKYGNICILHNYKTNSRNQVIKSSSMVRIIMFVMIMYFESLKSDQK